MSGTPEHWKVVKLKEVVELVRSEVDPQSRPDDMFNYLSIGNIESNSGQLVDFTPTRGREIRSVKHEFTAEDVLYSRLRPYLNKVFLPEFNGICATDLLPLRPRNYILRKYLALYLRSPGVVRYASGRMQGIELPRLPAGELLKLDVPLPSLAEQERIVETLERCFTSTYAAKQELSRIPKLTRRLRTAILSKAYGGELTATIHDDAQVPSLVARASQMKKRIKCSESASNEENGTGSECIDEPTGSVVPCQIPRGWMSVQLESLLREPMRNGRSAKPAKAGGGVPVLTLSAVTFKDFGPHNVKMCDLDFESVRDLWVENNDIFIARSNTAEYVGMGAIYEGPSRQFIYPDLMIRLRVKEDIVLPKYLAFYLDSQYARKYFQDRARSTAGSMPKINQGHILTLPVALAPYGIQRLIVEQISSHLSKVRRVEEATQDTMLTIPELESMILSKAFGGRLST